MQVSSMATVLAALLFSISLSAQDFPEPVNGLIAKPMLAERTPLPDPPLREADVMWQKTVWRVIDVREKMNLTFTYPERPLFDILTEAANNNEIQLYVDDDFSEVLSEAGRQRMEGTADTVMVTDPKTMIQRPKVIVNAFDVRDVKRYRVKEIWYFDKSTATLKSKIIGLSPLKEEYDENGNFKYELPLFWVYFPATRKVLARENAPLPGLINGNRSWDDLFASRFFSSSIIKADNIHDRRLSDYLSGRDAVLAGDKIDREIFNFEHDVWAQ
ncbi:gliding motility protein GldN [Lewinellaceae bacterium SD302]|nr:gliding motility protein GldN [Lewinellaceae bacterium SD302]